MIRHNILANPEAADKFITGVKRLKDPQISPWPGQEELSIYDFFVFWHHRAMMLNTPPTQGDRNAAHSGPVFLPWHRYMLQTFESFLRTTLEDDEFRLPYWDWAADAELTDPAGSTLWTEELMGQFIDPSWNVRLDPNPTGNNPARVNRMLIRAVSRQGRLPDIAAVRRVIRNQTVYDTPPYDRSVTGFRNFLEGWQGASGLHNIVHVWVGGDMLNSTSPNDPVFFLHHCNVDRIWSAWQNQHPESEYMPSQSTGEDLLFHRIDDPMHSFFSQTVTPRNMLVHNESYRYDTLEDLRMM